MNDTCPCGAPAVWYMTPDGDPLKRPLCHDCYAEWVTVNWESEWWANEFVPQQVPGACRDD